MPRSLKLFAVALFLACPLVAAAPCNLTMTFNCVNGACTAVTTNSGSTLCTGEYIAAIFADVDTGQASVTNFRTTLGLPQCFDSSSFPEAGVPFGLCIGIASLAPGNSFTATANVQPGTGAPSPLPIIAVTEVDDEATGDELAFVYAFNGLTVLTCTPVISVPPVAQSGNPYLVSWSPVSDPNATFTVEESTSPDFSSTAPSPSVTGLNTRFQHVVTSNTTYFYRVHANSCNGAPGPVSSTVSIVVQPVQTFTGRSGDAITPFGSTDPVTMKFFIPGSSAKEALDTTYTASTDKSFLTVTPASGTIPPSGTTLTVTANPTNLPPGANTGTLVVSANGATIANKSVSVSLVTPVTPSGKGIPPANALIIPAVAHAPGALGPFQSDVRLANASAATTSYQVTFTPTRTDGSKNGKTTVVNVDAGQTIALNDILRDFFGVGATDASGDSGQGALEIRPLNSASTLNYAASRTFTFNDKGTFGQFIAAIPFSAFATKANLVPIPGVPAPTANPVLSMQQVAQSTKFRTNLGLVEGSGTPATGTIKIFDDGGTLVRAVPYSLQPGEHQQNSLASFNVGTLDDGRIEVTVESSTGAVTAYASVLDNITNDPLAVTPVQVSQIRASRYVLPGMAALGGANNFHSDIRIYNGGSAQATVNATFYPQGNGTPKPFGPFSIEPGGVRAFDDVVANQFAANGQGGQIVVTTTAPTSLVATGRTYTIDASGGTFGQFIPGVMPSQGIGLGDRALQVLQLEESTNFRSNLGLAELSGNPVDVRVTAFVPDSKIGVSTQVHLDGNQFLQLGRVLASFGLGANVYNARVSVEVVGGSGRVTSYGSVIDNLSLDPTYVPAQP